MEDIKEVARQIAEITGDRLTGQKAADICAREGYAVTGVVLTKAATANDSFTGVRRCIVNLSAVRWFFDQDKWAEVMYPENRRTELQKDATPVGTVDRYFIDRGEDMPPEPAWTVKWANMQVPVNGTKLYTHPQPKAATVPEGIADQLLEKIDTLLAHVNEAHTAKSKEWAEANFQSADIALQKITEMVRASTAPSLPAQFEEGRTNSADETGGMVKRFGFDCTKNPPEIIPATNGAFVHYSDYVKLFQRSNSASLPAAEDARDGWISVEDRLPEIDLGGELHCFVTLRNKKTGKLRVTDAYWCNKPTDPEWGETIEAPDWALVDEDGDHVSVVGWADRTHHPDYSGYYESIGNQHAEVIAWQPVTYPAAPAMSQDSKGEKLAQLCKCEAPDCQDMETVPGSGMCSVHKAEFEAWRKAKDSKGEV